MIETDKYGRYHATNEGGYISWYEFACEIFRQAGMDEVKVTPVDSSAFPVKAKRPSNSRLNKDKLTENGFERLPAWQDALRYQRSAAALCDWPSPIPATRPQGYIALFWHPPKND